MIWKPTPRGFVSPPYEIFRSTRGQFSVWVMDGEKLALINDACEHLSGAKALAEHHQELVSQSAPATP